MLAKEELLNAEEIIPGLIVRHTSRKLGKMGTAEACEGVILGRISFSEFVDQVGDDFRELLDFMTEHDLHPGRPDEVLYCLDCFVDLCRRKVLRGQLCEIYHLGGVAQEAARKVG